MQPVRVIKWTLSVLLVLFTIGVILFVWGVVSAQAQSAPPAAAQSPRAAAALSEVQKLKAENFQLRVQLAQCQATLQDRETRLLSTSLSTEQNALVEEFRASLNAGKDDVFDWTTLTFKPPAPPATPPVIKEDQP